MLGAIVLAVTIQGGVQSDLATNLGALAKQVAAKNWVQAAATNRRLDRLIADLAPLEVPDIQVLAVPPQGLGMYTPLYKGVVRSPEILIYAQVRNHGLRSVHGFYELHLVSDLVVLDAAGKELGRDEALGESRYTARAMHRDTFVLIAVRTQGLPAGKYRIRLILHDRISKKRAQAETPFVIP